MAADQAFCYGEKNAERLVHCNGAGDPRRQCQLRIARLRKGFRGFPEPRQMAEKTLTAVVQEAFVQGVSTAPSTTSRRPWA